MKQQNKNKNTTCANKNPPIFYYKEEKKQGYDKKTYKKLVLNKLKVLGNFASIYTYYTTRNFGFCNRHLQPNLCSCIRQVAHDIQLHVTLHMQHVYTMLTYMLIHTY